MARTYGTGYREEIRLRDGRRARVGVLGCEHAAAVAYGFSRLSAVSRYQRFFTPKEVLSARELEYLTDLDGERHFALYAAVHGPDGWDGAAVARFVVVEPGVVEAALTVIDDYQGLGLGQQLFARLCDAARERGYLCVRSEVLAENRGMLALLGGAGAARSVALGRGVLRVDVPLTAPLARAS